MLVVPAVVPIPENSSQSTNFSKLINPSSGFEVKQRRFLKLFSMMRGTADSDFGRISDGVTERLSDRWTEQRRDGAMEGRRDGSKEQQKDGVMERKSERAMERWSDGAME